jgi:hypothetical protein
MEKHKTTKQNMKVTKRSFRCSMNFLIDVVICKPAFSFSSIFSFSFSCQFPLLFLVLVFSLHFLFIFSFTCSFQFLFQFSFSHVRFDCRKVDRLNSGPSAPRTAYHLPVPPPAPTPQPSAAPKVDSQSSSYDSQQPLQIRPVSPPRKQQKRRNPKSVPLVEPKPIPAGKTLEFDIEHWDDTLTELGVDNTAQQELYLLAQFSQLGAKAANHVISKVLKKVADGDQVRNWSAFVHSCVKTARHDLHWHDWAGSEFE